MRQPQNACRQGGRHHLYTGPDDITVNDRNLFALDRDEMIRMFGKPDLEEEFILHYHAGDVHYTFCLSEQAGTIRSLTVEKDFSRQKR